MGGTHLVSIIDDCINFYQIKFKFLYSDEKSLILQIYNHKDHNTLNEWKMKNATFSMSLGRHCFINCKILILGSKNVNLEVGYYKEV